MCPDAEREREIERERERERERESTDSGVVISPLDRSCSSIYVS
jgi:hypothetical protein